MAQIVASSYLIDSAPNDIIKTYLQHQDPTDNKKSLTLVATPEEWLELEWPMSRRDNVFDYALRVVDVMDKELSEKKDTPHLFGGWLNLVSVAVECVESKDIRQYRRLYNIYYFYALVCECRHIIARARLNTPFWRIDRTHSVYTLSVVDNPWDSNVEMMIDAIQHDRFEVRVILTLIHFHQDIRFACDILRWLGRSQNKQLECRDTLFAYTPDVLKEVAFPSAGVPESAILYNTTTSLNHIKVQCDALIKLARFCTNYSGKVFAYLSKEVEHEDVTALQQHAKELCRYDSAWYERYVL